MSVAVFIATAFGGGVCVGALFGYIGGRRSSREELDGAVELIAAMNAAPDRDDLAEVALKPERTGEHRPVMYQQTDEETLPAPATWECATHLQAPLDDDTGTGTIAHLRSGEWAPAAPRRAER